MSNSIGTRKFPYSILDICFSNGSMAYQLSLEHPGKRAFITGASGGLGRALGIELAGDGWTIGITDIREGALAESKTMIEEAGGRALAYHFDVSDKEAYHNAFKEFISNTGGIDLLVNNAGVGDSALFGEYDLEHWDWITNINLMAVIYGSHLAIPIMKEQGSGHIISVASAAGFANMPSMSMYNVSKAGVISLMETLHAELHSHKVHVSVVCPSFFQSGIMQHRKGDELTGTIAESIVQGASYSSGNMAKYILKAAGKKSFYIFRTHQAKFVYHFKRLFPFIYRSYKARQFSSASGIQWLERILKM